MFQARYTDPLTLRRVAGPTLFQTKQDADAWLATRHADLIRGAWQPERTKDARTPFKDYAKGWLEARPIKPRTRAEYRRLLDKLIEPMFGATPLAGITPELVRAWYGTLPASKPTQRARAYDLLRTILTTAVTDGQIAANPCHVRGGGTVKRSKAIRPATLDELATITEAMPERYRLLVLLSAFCALRFGEATELRVKDVDAKDGVLRVRRGVTRAEGQYVVATPKSAAGSRDVAVPPHLLPALQNHVQNLKANDLLFPAADGGHLAPATLYRHWYTARHVAGRDDLRWHDLRHTGAVLAAATGATIAELMARLGHSTPAMAMRYQHAAAERDRAIAAALSEIATGAGQRDPRP
jgi:integrase